MLWENNLDRNETMTFIVFRVIYSSTSMRRSHFSSSIEVIVVWLIALLIVSPKMYYLHVSEKFACYDETWEQQHKFIWVITVHSGSSIIPLIIMLIIYTLCAYKISTMTLPGDDKKMAMKRKKRNTKIIYMFGIIVILFFILTIPYAIFTMISSYHFMYDQHIFITNVTLYFHLTYLLYTISSFNSCTNPFIYAKMHENMKRTLTKHLNTWKSNMVESRSPSVIYTVASAYRNRAFTDITET